MIDREKEDIFIWEPNERETQWVKDHSQIRTYEVSIWTLQDDFITVLKYSNIENKGQIQEPMMRIATDGTQEFTFTIPMYLYNASTNSLEENPIWYNTLNGNIAVDMRKIKVIFNQQTDDEKVFEFLITKVNETHEEDQLFCHVSCEGLAFHELGKIGYKISLSSDDFYADDYAWFQKHKEREKLKEKGQEPEEEEEPQPIANLQYWLNKFLKPYPEEGELINPRQWYYKIEMNWDSFESSQDEKLKRTSDRIYEEGYPASWNVEKDDDKAITGISANSFVEYQEKERLVDLEESNIYNLTQNLAETFGVFCRYEYLHDENYHITGKNVIFYNNFIYEEKGYIDLTYPFTAAEVTREMDSTDLVTKMFVKSVDDDSLAAGTLTILNTEANRSGEDYLLNFDYLHQIKAISEEQYNEIPLFEAQMRDINNVLIPLETRRVALSDEVPSLEAKKKVAENAISLDNERITAASDLFNSLTEGDGYIEITPLNPAVGILLESEKGKYYLKLTEHGIDPESIRIFREFYVTGKVDYPEDAPTTTDDTGFQEDATTEDSVQSRLAKEIKTGYVERDEFGDVVKVSNIYMEDDDNPKRTVFLTYRYSPKLYYDKVIATWTLRLHKDELDRDYYTKRLDVINQALEKIDKEYNEKLEEKNELIKDFERMMGPALREGNWQPEDYKDCGDRHNDTFKITNESMTIDHRGKVAETKEEENTNPDAGQSTTPSDGSDVTPDGEQGTTPKKDEAIDHSLLDYFIWDTYSFADEVTTEREHTTLVKEDETPDSQPKRYPCIDLSNHLDIFTKKEDETWEDVGNRVNNLSIFFYDYNGGEWQSTTEQTPEDNSSEESPTNLNENDSVSDADLSSQDSNPSSQSIDPCRMRSFPVHSLCEYGFIKKDNQIKPVLILTGIDNIPETISEFATVEDKEEETFDLDVHSGNSQGALAEDITLTGINDSLIPDEPGAATKEQNRITMLDFIKSHPVVLGALTATEDETNNKHFNIDFAWSREVEKTDWIEEGFEDAYPRIAITSLAVKTSSDQLFLTYNNQELENFEDYYCLTKIPDEEEEKLFTSYEIKLADEEAEEEETSTPVVDSGEEVKPDDSGKENDNESEELSSIQAYYYITIKPEVFFTYMGDQAELFNKNLSIRYTISNADTAIYLDSIQVLKENAFPKVAYTVQLNVLSRDFLRTAYNKLSYIVHINDSELKFNNVMGYISSINLDLDKAWEDSVEIKNYKTKFEDLFSTILASTEAMKRNSFAINAAADAFTLSGQLRPWAIEGTIYKADLNYAFNNGTLTIDEKNGIWGVSPSGVVAIRGGGIFTSTQQDTDGNWVWNTGITPEGINATLITAGQLDTNRVMVYAGDKLRFQLNGQGLFAYKSFFEDLDIIQGWLAEDSSESGRKVVRDQKINAINEKLNADENSDLDAAQFVKMDANGLFLVVKKDALVLNNARDDYVKIGERLFSWYAQSGALIPNIVPEDGIERVSITWDGFTLRNYYNQKVFEADADTGNLKMRGTLFANDLYIGAENDETGLSLNAYLGSPDKLIIAGITDSSLNTILKNRLGLSDETPVTIYYCTENELIEFLEPLEKAEQAIGTELVPPIIWYNTAAPDAQLTLFQPIYKKRNTDNKYLNWRMVQINNNDFAKAIYAIYQSNLDNDKKAVIYLSEPKERKRDLTYIDPEKWVFTMEYTDKKGTHTYTIGETKPTDILEEKDEQARWQRAIDTNNFTVTLKNTKATEQNVEENGQNVKEEIPLDEQVPNPEKVQNQKNGDIWINYHMNDDDESLSIDGIYRWVEDYVNEESPLFVTDNGISMTFPTQNTATTDEGDTTEEPASSESNEGQESNSETNTPVNPGKWVLISDLSAQAARDQVANDLFAAEGKVARIAHGEYGLIFTGSKEITSIQLNKKVGLQIGAKQAYFRVNANQLGFVSADGQTPYLYYEDGNLFIMGTIFAKRFWVLNSPYDLREPYTFYDYLNYNFEDHVKVSENLGDIFDKAGEILAATRHSLTDLTDIIDKDFSILQNFRDDVAENLTPHAAKGPYHESHFKIGDIWEKTEIKGSASNLTDITNDSGDIIKRIQNPDDKNYSNENTIATYIAMYNWYELYDTNTGACAAIASEDGWNRTYDGSLAQIKGASMAIDNVAGTIEMLAENKIDIKTGGYLYLAADKAVDIVSNREVNIGGTYINIGSTQIIEEDNSEHINNNDSNTPAPLSNVEGGIRLVSSKIIKHKLKKKLNSDGSEIYVVDAETDSAAFIDEPIEKLDSHISDLDNKDNYDSNSTSKVYILPSGIEMASKYGIQIKSGAGINILSSAGNIDSGENKVAVISIDKDKGIWMGTDQTISLFAGKENDRGIPGVNIDGTTAKGTTVTRQGAAVEISSKRILFGAAEYYKATESSVSDVSLADATVVDLTSKQLILGVGAGIKHLENLSAGDILLSDENVSGVIIKASSIGMAVGSNTAESGDNRTLISIDENGIILGKAKDLVTTDEDEQKIRNDALEGSFIKLTKNGVFLGSKSQFYINTTNVYIDDSTAHKITSENPNGTWKGAAFGLGNNIKDWTKMGLAIIQKDSVTNDYPPAIEDNIDENTNKKIGEKFNSLNVTYGTTDSENGSWGLFFDGENLHVKGYVYAKGTRIIDPDGGNGYSLPDYLRYKFEDNVRVSDNLARIFNTAGEILSRAQRSVADVSDLVSEDFEILEGFKENVVANLTPVYTSKSKNHNPLFKPGDLWERLDENGVYDGTYIAIAYWCEIYKDPNTGEPSEEIAKNSTTETKGWTKTSDYSLAAITGANLTVDAEAGTVDIEAGNRVDIKSAGTIYLGANKSVDIVGNQEVNIGGKYINIGASEVIDATQNNTTSTLTSGIRLTTSTVVKRTITTEGTEENAVSQLPDKISSNNASSLVYILPTGIEMASKNGIQIKSGAGIDIKSSDPGNVSVISINKDTGLWLGSSKEINFFSGALMPDTVTVNNTEYDTRDANGNLTEQGRAWLEDNSTGAAVRINPTRILMGVSNLSNSATTAVDITSENIILGAGLANAAITYSTDKIEESADGKTSPYDTLKTNSNTSGVVISRKAIGLATGSATTENGKTTDTRNLLLMDDNGIILGQASAVTSALAENYSGAFVSIAKDGVRIGSDASLYIRTKNVVLDKVVKSDNSTLTYFGLGYMSDWSKWQNAPITTKETIGEKEQDVTYDWGLYFDGQNLYIQGTLYTGGLWLKPGTPSDNKMQTSWDNYFMDLFATAGDIIADIQNAGGKLDEINTYNNAIFTDFANKLNSRLVITNFIDAGSMEDTYRTISSISNGDEIPTLERADTLGIPHFKPGDIWTHKGKKYLAMAYQKEVQYANGENQLTSLKGWSLIEDYSLAGIHGAKMEQDATSGTISMWASSGIHLFTQKTDTKSSIDIDANGIVLASSKSIELGVGYGKYIVTNQDGTTKQETSSYNIFKNDDTKGSFSGLRLSDSDGIWLGSDKGIKLYAAGSSGQGASMSISPNEILFGVSGTNGNSVVDITQNKIIIGANGNIDTIKSATLSASSNSLSSSTTAGLRIKSDEFGLVTQTTETITNEENNTTSTLTTTNIILLNDDGISFGSQKGSSYSGMKINADTIAMDTWGVVAIRGSKGIIEFGSGTGKSKIRNFYVDIEGNVYCKSLTCENIVSNQKPTTPTVGDVIDGGTIDYGPVLPYNSLYKGNWSNPTQASTSFNIAMPGEYLLRVIYDGGSNESNTDHGYFQQAEITVAGKTFTASFPYYLNYTEKECTYSVYFNNTGSYKITGRVKIDPESMAHFDDLTATCSLYPNFKGGSVVEDMEATSSPQTIDNIGTTNVYQVSDKNTNNILAQLFGSWTSSITDQTTSNYVIQASSKDANGNTSWTKVDSLSTTIYSGWNNGIFYVSNEAITKKTAAGLLRTALGHSWDSTNKKYNITAAPATISGTLTGHSISLSGGWDSKTYTYSVRENTTTTLFSTTISGSWSGGTYTVKDGNTLTGLSTTLYGKWDTTERKYKIYYDSAKTKATGFSSLAINGSWSSGQYTVTGTGLSTKPEITVEEISSTSDGDIKISNISGGNTYRIKIADTDSEYYFTTPAATHTTTTITPEYSELSIVSAKKENNTSNATVTPRWKRNGYIQVSGASQAIKLQTSNDGLQGAIVCSNNNDELISEKYLLKSQFEYFLSNKINGKDVANNITVTEIDFYETEYSYDKTNNVGTYGHTDIVIKYKIGAGTSVYTESSFYTPFVFKLQGLTEYTNSENNKKYKKYTY